MATSWAEAYVQCPFYKYDDGKRAITCEGAIDGAINRSLFTTQKKQRNQLEKYCCKLYFACPVYQMLKKKYEDEK